MAGLGTQSTQLPKTADYSDRLVALAAGNQPTKSALTAATSFYRPNRAGEAVSADPAPAQPGGQTAAAPPVPAPAPAPAPTGVAPAPTAGAPSPFGSGWSPTSSVSGMGGLGSPAGFSSIGDLQERIASLRTMFGSPGGIPARPGAGQAPDGSPLGPQLGPVARGVQTIIDDNSPLMQQAAAQGRDQLNARGLVNSSMAIGAAQAEMLKAATPIASQEADIGSRMDLAKLDASTQTTLQASRNAAAAALQETQGKQALAQQAAEAKARADLQGTIGSQQLTLAEKEALSRAELADKDAASRAALQATDLASVERQNAAKLEASRLETQANIAAKERGDLAAAIAQVGSNQQQALSNTLQNDKISASARGAAQENIGTISSNTITRLENVYGVSTSAPGGTAPAATTTTTPAAATATAPAAGAKLSSQFAA